MSSNYTIYSAEVIQQISSEHRIILYFHADWCMTCRNTHKYIEQSLADIPEDMIVLKVDFDQFKDLKTKYHVKHQNTYVEIDQRENLIKLWDRPHFDQVIGKKKGFLRKLFS